MNKNRRNGYFLFTKRLVWYNISKVKILTVIACRVRIGGWCNGISRIS